MLLFACAPTFGERRGRAWAQSHLRLTHLDLTSREDSNLQPRRARRLCFFLGERLRGVLSYCRQEVIRRPSPASPGRWLRAKPVHGSCTRRPTAFQPSVIFQAPDGGVTIKARRLLARRGVAPRPVSDLAVRSRMAARAVVPAQLFTRLRV